MASTDETFDPNDLDSIDALLDEAEQDVVAGKDVDTVEDVAPATAVQELPAETSMIDDELSDLLDIEQAAPAAELADNVPPPAAQVKEAADPKPEAKSKPEEAPVAPPPQEEEYIPRRGKTQNQSKEISAAEMDSIKKLIVIFGSTLVVLMLIGIGIGIWAALAGSAGLDEETQTKIEEIKLGTESNTVALSKNAQGMNAVEKKIDALSYQLEQMTADITALAQQAPSSPVQSVAQPIVPPAVNNGHAVAPHDAHAAATHQAAPVTQAVLVPAAQTMAPAVVVDAAMMDKLNSVQMGMVKAQKRIDEVNKRVKQLQEQYGKLLHGVKTVEKQLVGQQVQAQAKKEADKEKPESKQPSYQYSAPDPMMYDQANPDSYP
ncbi:hypothetical protein [Thiomicrorhabdus cannonii]|uniref:hypothetical protein n=1 Tax=Thiomicrorhabdus cannonii TaxID=2748011 RepID=UPI0015BE9790|nr:hypothetical protein [Thiomicrorhabdus cannonii]